MGAPRRRHPLIKHVLIQRVYETIPADRLAVRQNLHTAVLNKVTATSQFVTAGFNYRAVFIQTGYQRKGWKLGARDAGGFQRSLLIRVEMIYLLLDHLFDAIGHTEFDLVDWRH